MPWPFKRAPRQRAAATDRVVEALQQEAAGRGPRGVASQAGGLQVAAAIWGRACDAVVIRGADLPAPWLSDAVRALLERGEAVQVIESVAPLTLLPASSHDISGGPDPASWRYRVDLASPGGAVTRTLPREGVLHFTWATRAGAPWRGLGPASLAPVLAALATGSECALRADMRATSGTLIPVPSEVDDEEVLDEDGNPVDANAELRASLAKLQGNTAFIETTAGGWAGSGDRPQGDWKQQRIGPEPDAGLAKAWAEAGHELAQVAGVPSALLANVEGAASREAWRRFVFGAVTPLLRRIAGELRRGLETDIAFDASGLHASDITGRARAFQSMVSGGIAAADAAALAGLIADDDRD